MSTLQDKVNQYKMEQEAIVRSMWGANYQGIKSFQYSNGQPGTLAYAVAHTPSYLEGVQYSNPGKPPQIENALKSFEKVKMEQRERGHDSDSDSDRKGAGAFDFVKKHAKNVAKAAQKEVVKKAKEVIKAVTPHAQAAAKVAVDKLKDAAVSHLNEVQQSIGSGAPKKRGRPRKEKEGGAVYRPQLEEGARAEPEVEGGRGNFFKKLGQTLKRGAEKALDVGKTAAKAVGNAALNEIKSQGADLVKNGIQTLQSTPEVAAGAGKKRKGGKAKEPKEAKEPKKRGPSEYNKLVSSVMKSKKMIMKDALQYIKSNNLYKKKN